MLKCNVCKSKTKKFEKVNGLNSHRQVHKHTHKYSCKKSIRFNGERVKCGDLFVTENEKDGHERMNNLHS
ncbi:hypothetical protein AQUCO_01600367v1 [Aquilegia coerulea]|uniref:Uncharacterized protein n=1 Tax=Aquilegia coerulea TaxID=218851 RepID=A0A2G5DR95_AQUCA|nr:hypothetical protein AQUCO_01600367v1 [Aquilegia coerulea]